MIPPRLEYVEKLMLAALQGMQPLSEECTSDEVINAMLNLAGRAVDLVVQGGAQTELIRAFLYLQLLKVAPDLTKH